MRASWVVAVIGLFGEVCRAQPQCTEAHRCDTVVYRVRGTTEGRLQVLAVTPSSVLITTTYRDDFLGLDDGRRFARVDRATRVVDASVDARENHYTMIDCSRALQAVLFDNVLYWKGRYFGLCSVALGGSPAHLLTDHVVTAFVITPSSIFFTSGVNVERQPLAGGTVAVVDTVASVTLLARSSHFVVWSTSTGTLRYSAHATGTVVGTIATNLGQARALAADDTYAYLATTQAILRVTIATGATAVLVSQTADGLVADPTHVYWFRTSAGEIGKVPISGGAPVVLSSSAGAPGSIALDGTSVWYADRHDESLHVVTPQ